MSGRIFISYRRDDASYPAGRLYDRLSAHFLQNQIFIDVDNLEPGADFVEAIEASVGSCDALIAVIGKRWLISSDEEGKRRLDSPDDFVRLEIATALKRKIRVIPVLVDGASMPRSSELPDDLKLLVRRNALEVSHTRFNADLGRLVAVLERVLEKADAERKYREEKDRVEAHRLRREEKERLEAQRREDVSLEAQRIEAREKELMEASRRLEERQEQLEAEHRQEQEHKRLETERREREEKQSLEAELREKEGLKAESESALYGKVAWRIIPLLFVCYIAAYLDRVNVSFAKLQMQSDVPEISDTVFGIGAGIFFLGYFIFEVPSNILMEKVGARLWIARIMITWGMVSCGMIFVNSPWLFYGLRLLLGFAEAGFFPGIILYLTYWFPSRRRGEMVALFMLAIALTGVVGAPLSGWILQEFSGSAGLKGWQILFLFEGIPSIVLGIFVPWLLANGVGSAHWLNAEEKQLLEQNLQAEEGHKERLALAEVFLNPRLILFAMIYFCSAMGLYGTGFWIPQLIKNTGVKDPLYVGLLTAIPYTFGAVAMVVLGRSSDRSGKRRLHFAMASLLGAVGIVISNLFRQDTFIAMVGLTLATMGILATFPLFWPMPTAMLAGTAAAAGIAWINSLGNLAGFFGPSIVGWFTDLTKRSDYGLYVVAAALVLGSFLVLGFVPPKLGADNPS